MPESSQAGPSAPPKCTAYRALPPLEPFFLGSGATAVTTDGRYLFSVIDEEVLCTDLTRGTGQVVGRIEPVSITHFYSVLNAHREASLKLTIIARFTFLINFPGRRRDLCHFSDAIWLSSLHHYARRFLHPLRVCDIFAGAFHNDASTKSSSCARCSSSDQCRGSDWHSRGHW